MPVLSALDAAIQRGGSTADTIHRTRARAATADREGHHGSSLAEHQSNRRLSKRRLARRGLAGSSREGLFGP